MKLRLLLSRRGNGSRRVKRQRCQDRNDLFTEKPFEPLSLLDRPVVAARKEYLFIPEGRENNVVQHLVLLPDEETNPLPHFAQDLARRQAIRALRRCADFGQLLVGRHANLEKLIHVCAGNAQKAKAFEKRE